MTPIRITIVFAVCVLMTACARFDLVGRYESATETYFAGDKSSAQAALTSFLSDLAQNLDDARADKGGDYRVFAGLSWLRLASIHQADGDKRGYQQAISAAIAYFEEIPSYSGNAQYRQDREGNLMALLRESEARDPPKWKKPETKDSNKGGT